MCQGLKNLLTRTLTHTTLKLVGHMRMMGWKIGWIISYSNLHLKLESPLLHFRSKKEKQEYSERLFLTGGETKARRAQAI